MTSAPKLKVPEKLKREQRRASDPTASAWVSANAGSGKTYVLTQRVIRLLLGGVPPAKILCLTFTKVAAANMAIGVFDRLAGWAVMSDEELGAALVEIDSKRPDAARLVRARRLFAEVLETPGGLKVQTIHAFCSALMHQFPFEAGVAAGFEVMEERQQDEVINEIRLEVLLGAAQSPGTRLADALGDALVAAADMTFAEVVRDAVGRRVAYEAWRERCGSSEAALAELDGACGVTRGDTVGAVDDEVLCGDVLPRSEWLSVAAVLQQGGKTDQAQAARLREAAAATGSSAVAAYLNVFLTTDRKMRERIVTQAIDKADPALAARFAAEKDRMERLVARRRAIVARDRSAALATITFAILERYRAEKARRGLLDYDDLIERTRKLLANEGAAWVMYKLDLGIDHVLIDEAQDTSPAQWDVIRLLTAEFFAGKGARDSVKRSIFAVGDEKQSIYSFQGAEPDRFAEERVYFEARHRASGVPFVPVPLLFSLRSTRDVLGAVDEVFSQPHAYAGLAHDPVATLHEAVRTEAPGCVEVWPLVEAPKRQAVQPWDAPFDAIIEDSAPVLLARQIAAHVAAAIAQRQPVEWNDKAPLRPGDILILVRQRGPLFEAIIRALKYEQVEVAGADRLVLTDHIAIMDMMSLADALLLREDDLALAEALKSPLFGLDEDALFALAHERKGSLRAALEDTDLATRLDALEARARTQSPFDFYAELLGADGGREKIRARLGYEADDALDEFLALAIEYERTNAPSLQGFVAWLRAANAEVKRDMAAARDEVRVMTAHGAKGLEAPIVILADTTTKPQGLEPVLATARDEDGAPIFWLGRKADDAVAGVAARQRAYTAAEHEHLRLLYVAMTRARDKLIVCGARRLNQGKDKTWFNLVEDALKPGAYRTETPGVAGKVWRWQKSNPNLGLEKWTDPPPPEPEVVRPAWLTKPLAAPAGGGVLTPSTAVAAQRPRTAREEAARAKARARGTLVHRLLQALPEVPAAARAEASEAFLRRNAVDFSAAEQAAIAAQVEAIVTAPAFARLFAAGTLAEVPIVGTLERRGGDPIPVSGQVDRLAITADAVLIADFKTDRGGGSPDTSAAYATQLALYRALLQRLYPGRRVKCALVWTETQQLQEIAEEILDREAHNLGIAPP